MATPPHLDFPVRTQLETRDSGTRAGAARPDLAHHDPKAA
jgi:hypothetical protein